MTLFPRLLAFLLLTALSGLADPCPTLYLGGLDDYLVPLFLTRGLISQFAFGTTGSSFTIFTDSATGRDFITIHSSSGQDVNVDPSNSASFLASNCPGEFASKFSPARYGDLAKATAAPRAIAGQAAQGVAAGDFNGDGVSDSAVVTRLGVSIYLGQVGGPPRLVASLAVNTPTQQAITAADFNGDGKLDLAVLVDGATGSAPGMVALFTGLGNGAFNPAVYIATGQISTEIAAADFNGDGKPDLAIFGAVTSQSGLRVAVLLNKGDATFNSPLVTPTGASSSLVAADMDGDGKMDIVTAARDQITVLSGNGDGTFRAANLTKAGIVAPYLTYTDLNHDGRMDLAVYDGYFSAILVLLGNGDGTFQLPKLYAAASRASCMAIVALGDGGTAFMVPDRLQRGVLLAVSDSAGLLNLPRLQIVGPTGNQQFPTVLLADLNGDSKADLIVADGNGVAVQLRLASGALAPAVAYAPKIVVTAAAAADFNNDGKADLALATPNGLSLLSNRGDGTFSVPIPVSSAAVSQLQIADFNGDGRPDIATLSATGAVQVFLGKGDGSFQAAVPATLSTAGTPGSFAMADFNGDGKPDLIAGFNRSGASGTVGFVSYLRGNGDGTFAAPQQIPLPDAFRVSTNFTVGDVNGDGRADLLYNFSDDSGERLLTYLGQGDGTFKNSASLDLSVIPAALFLTDVDKDGKLDLLVGSCCGLAEPAILFGNGDGSFQPEKPFLPGPGPVSFAVSGDLIAVGGYEGLSGVATVTLLSSATAPSAATLTIVSTANAAAGAVAPASLAAAFGTNLAQPVSLRDANGVTADAKVLYASATQVNFLVPATAAPGAATVTSGGSAGQVKIAPVAPGLFALNAAGLAAANVILVSGATQTPQSVFTVDGAGVISANPISLGGPGDTAILVLFGTGLRAAATAGTTVSVGGVNATVQYAGPQGGFDGLDQVNVVIPPSLAGKGAVAVQLSANGIAANTVTLTIR